MNEQIYNDFVTKLLPQIRTGLSIPKDYFQDVFGRYVHYLIIIDTILAIVFGLFAIVLGCLAMYCLKKKKDEGDGYSDWEIGIFVFSLFAILSCCGTIVRIDNLIKDKYVPEIRVLEIIKNTNN